MKTILFLVETILLSTGLYLFLHKKTSMQRKFIIIDNGLVILTILIIYFTAGFLNAGVNSLYYNLLDPLLITGFAFTITMIRFWRTPKRNVDPDFTKIVSPADGNVIYIKRIEYGETPFSIKGGQITNLNEITKIDLLLTPCWLIGINMTPFDVHKNCAPIDGQIVLQKHTSGSFFSLKSSKSETENERNTFIIKNDNIQVGFTQIASRLVRKIAVYKKEGAYVQKGDWLGMIRFGSQVDVIIPINCDVKVNLKEQIYAGKTILASFFL